MSRDMDPEAHLELIAIIESLGEEEKTTITNLEEDDIILLHHGLGSVIRNQFRAGGLRRLLIWSRRQLPDGAQSLDALSWPILAEIWNSLRPDMAP